MTWKRIERDYGWFLSNLEKATYNSDFVTETDQTPIIHDEWFDPQYIEEVTFDEKLQVPVIQDTDRRKYYIINASDWVSGFSESNRSYIRRTDEYVSENARAWTLWFGMYSPTLLFYWKRDRGEDLEGALEESAEFLDDAGWKGHFVSQENINENYIEATIEINEKLGKSKDANLSDHDAELAQDRATADLTYTESGYIDSQEWGIWFDSSAGSSRNTNNDREYIAAIMEAAYIICRLMYPPDESDREIGWEPSNKREPEDWMKPF